MKRIILAALVIVSILTFDYYRKAKQVDFNKNHPERKADEVFLGNVSSPDDRSVFYFADGSLEISGEAYNRIGWETKRMGEVAYDDHGKKIKDLLPVFVKKSEIKKENPALLKELEP